MIHYLQWKSNSNRTELSQNPVKQGSWFKKSVFAVTTQYILLTPRMNAPVEKVANWAQIYK